MTTPNDLMQYLLTKYIETSDDGDIKHIEEFVENSRKVLRENQPITTGVMGADFTITLQDGTQLAFVENQDELAEKNAISTAIPVTQPLRPGHLPRAHDRPITGG